MTLPEIVARLERIEDIEIWCERCDQPAKKDTELADAIAELRRDIEMFLIRTEGTLRT